MNIDYNETTCPNPEALMKEAFTQVATLTKKAICEESALNKAYTDTEITKVQDQINVLTDTKGSAKKLADLIALVDTLDLNENESVVDDLLSIKSIAEEALATANLAKTGAEEAKASALDVAQKLADFQSSVNNSLADHSSKIDALKTTSDKHAADIEELKNRPEADVTEEELKEAICNNNKKFADGVSASLVDFKTIMEGACPVDTDSDGEGAVL